MHSTEIAVSNAFGYSIIFGAILFLAKSIYDLVRSKKLSKRQKVNLSFIIAIIPIYGSVVFYFYESNFGSVTNFFNNK
jgi:hypothetical protein